MDDKKKIPEKPPKKEGYLAVSNGKGGWTFVKQSGNMGKWGKGTAPEKMLVPVFL